MKTNLRFMALVLLGMMLSVNQVWGMDDSYTVGTTKLASVSNGDLVAWGTSNTQLASGISSNWVTLSSKKSDWIVFKVVSGTNGFYLQNVSDNKYVYSSATKKVAFDATNKTLLTITDKGSDHKSIVYNSTAGYYTYNSSGIRPYASNVYTDAFLYAVTASTKTAV